MPQDEAQNHVEENASELSNIIDRLEALESQKSDIAEDIKEVKAEAKALGFDMKVITAVLKIRKQPPGEHDEFNELVDAYLKSLD